MDGNWLGHKTACPGTRRVCWTLELMAVRCLPACHGELNGSLMSSSDPGRKGIKKSFIRGYILTLNG